MAATIEEQTLQRLDQILRVLAIQVGEGLSITERARLLKVAGLDNQTIADVLNTTPATVRTLTANLGRKRTTTTRKRKPLS
jgi:DNA-binding CsgD family transcriptional regulator